MCGSGYILRSHVCSSHVRVSASASVCLYVREFGKKRLRVCLWCLSHAVSPYQAGGLTKARDPCQAVLDNCTWSECSWETRRDLRKLGLIRNTSPDLLSQSGIRPRCVYACAVFSCTHTHTLPMHVFSTPTEPQSHWPIYSTMEMAKTQEADQTHQRQNNTKPPYGYINSFTWNSFTATFTRYKNGASGQKIYCIDFLTSGFISAVWKSQLQQRSLCRIWSP